MSVVKLRVSLDLLSKLMVSGTHRNGCLMVVEVLGSEVTLMSSSQRGLKAKTKSTKS